MLRVEALVEQQVLQRDASGTATITVCAQEAGVEARVVHHDGQDVVGWRRVVPDMPDMPAELVVPAGGPYSLQARAGSTGATVVSDFLVGDLWVLAGQSNMQGFGRREGLSEPSPQVRAFDMARRWRPATDPVHVLSDSPDRVHNPPLPEGLVIDDATRAVLALMAALGGSVAPSFGNELAARSGVPVGLIATAHAATSIEQWSPELHDQGGDSLYGSMLLSVKAAGGRVAGVLWYQGESDCELDTAPRYADNLRRLVEALRHDLGNSALPVFVAQLGRWVEPVPELDEAWSTVREALRRRDLTGASGVVATIDLPLDDAIHIGTAGLHRLGRRFARVVSGLTAPDLESWTVDGATVAVTFCGVSGRLSPPEHIGGFSVRDAAGNEVPLIFRTRVADDGPDRVVLLLSRPPLPGEVLWYGYGVNPYCNLVDEADMAVPTFGPLPLDV